MSVLFLKRSNAPDLAYRALKGREDLPAVIFCGGFRSDMEGTKAAFLQDVCARREQTYIRFDYRGHGQSGGDFKDGTIGLWLADALDILDTLTTGPVILIGSSMGGWLSLRASVLRKARVTGLIGLAAAPDFTREIAGMMNAEQHQALKDNGMFYVPNDCGDPYPISAALINDGEAHIMLDHEIDIDCPVRLIQGMKDTDVAWQTAHRISNALKTTDKKVYLREEGDHRLSTPDDLALLEKLVEELSGL